MRNSRQQSFANSRFQTEDLEEPLNWGLVNHIDPKDGGKSQSEEAAPLFPPGRRRRSDDDEDAQRGAPQGASMGGLLAVVKMALPLVLLFLVVALLSKYSRYIHIPFGTSSNKVKHVQPVPEAQYCVSKMAGEPNITTGNHSDLPSGAHTVYVNFRTTKAGQTIATWADSCAQLLLTDAGTMEYRTRSSRHSDYSTLSDSDIKVTDGFWHQAAIVISESGHGYLYVDGSLAANGVLAEDPFGCAGLQEVHFHGSVESLRIFQKPLHNNQIGLVLDAESNCKYMIHTSTTTTTTATSTHTSSTTKTSTITRAWSNASELPVIDVATPPPLPTSTSTATFTSTATDTITFTSTSTRTVTQTTTMTATRTSTSTRTATTTTRTSTSTSTTMPRPSYLSSGIRSDAGLLQFVGAGLPVAGKGLTLIANIHTEQTQRWQEIISWGTVDKEDGCVSLHLSSAGTLEYSELPAGSSAWTTVAATPEKSLADGDWHIVAVSRSPIGLTYLYVDSKPVGQGMIPADRPRSGPGYLDNVGKAAGTCGGGEPSETAFDGSITGVNLFDSALTQWQLEEVAERMTAPGRRLRRSGGASGGGSRASGSRDSVAVGSGPR